MNQLEWTTFETSLGWCGIAWIEQGGLTKVARLQLPEARRENTEARMMAIARGRQASVPPTAIDGIIERVRRHLSGEVQDFRDVTVDLSGVGEFERRVYEAARQIPAGKTRAYGELARDLNQPSAAQAVGQAMGRNPVPVIIPCHRVVAADRRPGGFSAPGGRATKAKLLELEGAGSTTQGWLKTTELPLTTEN